MVLENFIKLVQNEVTDNLEEKESCRINTVLKNNGLELVGLTIMTKEVNISPTIYLNSFYDEYLNGNITITETVKEIRRIYEKHRIDSSVDIREFMDYEKIKDRIIFKLVNTQKNQQLLEDVPHIDICDLSIIFQCLISEEAVGSATITIHNAHLALWDIDKEELYAIAMHNTPLLRQYELKNIRTVLCELAAKRDEPISEMIEELPFEIPMYVLTNRGGQNGAGCILYPGLLEKFSEAVKGDFYIVPSSIHETILVPLADEADAQFMLSLIKEVNENEVPREEVLSDSLYIYRKSDSKIHILSMVTA